GHLAFSSVLLSPTKARLSQGYQGEGCIAPYVPVQRFLWCRATTLAGLFGEVALGLPEGHLVDGALVMSRPNGRESAEETDEPGRLVLQFDDFPFAPGWFTCLLHCQPPEGNSFPYCMTK